MKILTYIICLYFQSANNSNNAGGENIRLHSLERIRAERMQRPPSQQSVHSSRNYSRDRPSSGEPSTPRNRTRRPPSQQSLGHSSRNNSRDRPSSARPSTPQNTCRLCTSKLHEIFYCMRFMPLTLLTCIAPTLVSLLPKETSFWPLVRSNKAWYRGSPQRARNPTNSRGVRRRRRRMYTVISLNSRGILVEIIFRVQ